MNYLNISESVPVLGRYDVIVAGGGVAGVAAALAARRHGKKVMLVEKTILLGGLATIGLINFFVPMCNGRGRKIMSGMVDELLDVSIRYGFDTIPEVWKNGEPKEPANVRYVSKFSPQIFAIAMTDLLAEEGVELMFDTIVTRPVMDGTHCSGLIVENKSGRGFYEAGIVIDATGDSDILRRSGMPTVTGENYYTYIGNGATVETCKKVAETGDIRKLYTSFCGGYASLYGKNHPDGMKTFHATDAADVNEYLIRNHRQMLDSIKDSDRFSREITTLPTMVQFRKGCRIDGDYTLLETDKYKHFDDSVAAICDFDRRDCLYEVPFRTMIRKEYGNLIAAGRCVAGDGYAWDILRVIPPAIATGQAAGTAAALALDSSCPLADLNIGSLQSALEEGKMDIHFDDSLIPASAEKAEDRVDVGHI